MITVVCGLIGAGKTTWAKKHFETVIDRDDFSSKAEQLEALRSADPEKAAAYITCYPTREEFEALKEIGELSWIWIGTTQAQAKQNILSRARERDLKDLGRILKKNSNLAVRLAGAPVRFKIIDVFETGERW